MSEDPKALLRSIEDLVSCLESLRAEEPQQFYGTPYEGLLMGLNRALIDYHASVLERWRSKSSQPDKR